MANEFQAMGSALYGRLGTVQYTYYGSGTVPTTGTLGCYDTVALQQSPLPYVVYQLQDSLALYTFGPKSGESADYAVKVVSNRQTPSAQAYAIYDQLHEELQDAVLVIAGSYPLRCRRTSRFAYPDSDQFWHVGGIYRIDKWEA